MIIPPVPLLAGFRRVARSEVDAAKTAGIRNDLPVTESVHASGGLQEGIERGCISQTAGLSQLRPDRSGLVPTCAIVSQVLPSGSPRAAGSSWPTPARRRVRRCIGTPATAGKLRLHSFEAGWMKWLLSGGDDRGNDRDPAADTSQPEQATICGVEDDAPIHVVICKSTAYDHVIIGMAESAAAKGE